MVLSNERKEIYDKLEKRIVNTPLIKYDGDVVNNNQIWIKKQCDGLFGSHYDMPYLQLFKHYESLGIIKPGDKVFDATSGSAGVSMAGIGKTLGYECYVVLPEGGEKARENAILQHLVDKDHLKFTPKDQYVNGFIGFTGRFLVTHRDTFYLNHSMGKTKEDVNEVSLSGFEIVAKESINSLKSNGETIDYFVPAIGNGSSLLGPGRVFDKSETKIIGFEPFQAGLAYELLYPGKYTQVYGIEPGTLPRHRLPGMSFQIKDRHPPIPHIIRAIQDKILDDVILVSDSITDTIYADITGTDLTKQLPHWDKEQYLNFGRSTNAGIAVCKKIAEHTFNKNMLIIGYDKIDRYDL